MSALAVAGIAVEVFPNPIMPLIDAVLAKSVLPVCRKARLQDERGFSETISAIMGAAEKRLALLDRRRRTTCPASDLIVGLQCGGSDAFSGVTCNPAVGYAADLLVRAGATVMFSEVTARCRASAHSARCYERDRARSDSRDALV